MRLKKVMLQFIFVEIQLIIEHFPAPFERIQVCVDWVSFIG